jgi:hypothetical protein
MDNIGTNPKGLPRPNPSPTSLLTMVPLELPLLAVRSLPQVFQILDTPVTQEHRFTTTFFFFRIYFLKRL